MRLEAIGGSLQLHSSPGAGTIVEAVLPAEALQRLREP